MKKDNENPYRIYRIVGSKKIDGWFYEEGDSRRTHAKAYQLFILPLYGICPNSFLDYRNVSDELLECCPQPDYIEVSIWLPVVLVKLLGPSEANRFSRMLQYLVSETIETIRETHSERTIDADALLRTLAQVLREKVPAPDLLSEGSG
ncbi:MAG: hypothetical protein K2K30_05510 [Alistipes sp.]|nr:hypothetical protein [Alistipes sp.]